MNRITLWQASDGKRFAEKWQCEKYEELIAKIMALMAEPPQKWALSEVDPICNSAAEVVEKLQAENEKLRQVLEIARRYAAIEYGQSASCRMIVSEIQHAFPTPSILTISNPA